MVIGNPILHSKSPLLHALAYKAAGIDAVLLPREHTDVQKLIAAIRTLSVGLSAVTMPFKQSSMRLLDSIDPAALKIDAINTIINRNGKLIGYNTDIFGIEYALKKLTLRNKNVLLLGAGGAAQAAAYTVKKNGGQLIYANRTLKRAQALQKKFGGRITPLNRLTPKDIGVIINATPIGMYPDIQSLPLPESLLGRHQMVFDLVYNPAQTALLKSAKRAGAQTISGLDMFVAQGVRQVELWTGKKIITPKLVVQLKRQIEKTL